MADRVGVMSQGRLEQIAVPSELYDSPATAFVAEFVGTMNRVPGELRGQAEVTALGMTVPVQEGSADGLVGDVDVLVRPEGLRVAAEPNGNGIVTDRTFLGSLTRVSVRLSGDLLVKIDKQSTEAADMLPGTSVSVTLPSAAVLVAARA